MTKDEKDQLTPELIKGYHDMAEKSMSLSQEIIDELKGGMIGNEDVSLVRGIQTGLDHAAHTLWILRDRGLEIDPTVLHQFNILNQNIAVFNNANHQNLIQTREIGDITEMPRNEAIEIGGSQVTKDKKNLSEAEVHKYDSAISKLRRIKEALSSATTPEAARKLIAEFLKASIGIPQDIIPADLSYSTIESMYMGKMSELTNTMTTGEPNGKDKESGEKAAELATVSIKIVTEEINNFLDRDEIKASGIKNKKWAKNPSIMTANDAMSFTKSHDKEKEEEHILIGLVLRDPAEKVLERIDLARNELMLVHKHENHSEVINYDNKVIKELQRYAETTTKLGERFQDKSEVLKNTEVVKILGEDKAVSESQSYADKGKAIEQYAKTLSDDLAKRRARRLVNAMTPEPVPTVPLSPTSTPNKPTTPTKGNPIR
ncbi:MAG: hypothetical protein WCP46_08565 [Alphaproteobacteria bacterium]